MQNLISTLLPQIQAHRLPLDPRLQADADFIFPNYGGLSLVNLPASVCAWLGIPAFGAPPLAGIVMNQHARVFRHVILLVVDGMGLDTLQAALESPNHPDLSVWHEFDSLSPLTSISPSTTSAALTTLWTGQPPAAHGVMAYEVWLKEYGLIANLIRHAPLGAWEPGSLAKSGFDPLAFLPVPTFGAHLARHGVQAAAFQHVSIAHSGLSNMLLRDVEVKPFRSLSDLWFSLEDLLDARAGRPAYTYIYWGDLDEHSHRFGPHDPRAAMEYAVFSRQLSDFLRRRAGRFTGDTLLLVTADHGHLSTPKHPSFELRNHPDLRDCLVMLPSGEARMPFVYLRPGYEDRFLSYLETAWPGMFLAVPSERVLQAGLFGPEPHDARVRDRIGDYVIVPREHAYWYFGAQDNLLLGRHGGMSRTEMLVPLLSRVL